MADLGLIYEKGKDVDEDQKKAFEWYKNASDMGNGFGMVKLGRCYEKGKGVKQEIPLVVELYRKAIALENPRKMVYLGFCSPSPSFLLIGQYIIDFFYKNI
jgi:TPR repeat protein